MIINGDALEVLKRLEDNSVHCCITSSPYYGLRKYGLPPVIWGGDKTCDHVWKEVHPPGYRKSDTNPGPMQHEGNKNRENLTSDTCSKCGAWRGELGLEPSPEMFVSHLVEVFREVRRVLRPDGVLWANIGDSYAGSGVNDGTKTPGLSKARERGDVNTISRPNTKLAGYKNKDMIGIPWMLAFALRADGWWLRADLPWIKRNCLGSGTRIYVQSQKGVMPMTIHDLMKLDPKTVKLWNGEKWTQVTDLHQTPDIISDGIEIEFRSGEIVSCTREHRWNTTRGLLHASDLKPSDVVSKVKLADTNSDPITYMPDSVGRIVGLFLAEGSFLTRADGDGIVFTFSQTEARFDEEIKKFALDYGGSHHSHIYEGSGKIMSVIHGRVPIAIIKHFILNKKSNAKRLSNKCWQRNDIFLRALLGGYLDGDGHNDKDNHRWRLGFCKNDFLASDLRTLCARLGVSIRLKRGWASAIKGQKLFPLWRGQIRFNQTDRSVNSGNFIHKLDSEIIAIRKASPQHFYDIGVADEPHLFALASGILTHNSMPSSVKDRPSSSIEHVFLLSKSKKYYYDYVAVMQPSSESYNKDKRPRGKIRQCVNPNSKYPDEGQFKKQDNVGNNTYTGFNARYEDAGTGLRFMRDSDFFFRTWQGLLHNEDGEPMALVVNPRGYKGAHFACFPIQLVEPMILAGTSEKGVCEKCGSPWKRVTSPQLSLPAIEPISRKGVMLTPEDSAMVLFCEQGNGKYRISLPGDKHHKDWTDQPVTGGSANHYVEKGYYLFVWDTPKNNSFDWQPTCTCNAPAVPAIVLDPFAGSSATGVACKKTGRNYLGIELNPEYVEMGYERIKAGK